MLKQSILELKEDYLYDVHFDSISLVSNHGGYDDAEYFLVQKEIQENDGGTENNGD